MIKFFRPIRKSYLMENKTSKYFKYAIGEIILVVIGILIALQINNWNENKKEQRQEIKILKSLQNDLRSDIQEFNTQLVYRTDMINQYTNCLDILSQKKEGTKEEFMQDFRTILQVGGVSLNTTTFNNLESTGDIRLVRNEALADRIVTYYNSDYLPWETALRDYTRNITAPYFLKFDYLPQVVWTEANEKNIVMPGKPSDYIKPERPLDDYKQDYFIINTLRQKIWNLNGIVLDYNTLLQEAISLSKSIQDYLDSI